MTSNETVSIILTGLGATAVTDVWTLVRRRLFGTTAPNFALVGRWIGLMKRGRFRHASIAAAPEVRAEGVIGWATHYLVGSAFAFLLPAFFGPHWIRHPTLAPALIVGIATVAAPFFIMQPAMGAGIAASRTPHPAAARLQSLLLHTVFGLGLYAAGRSVSFLFNGD
jgi:hypothetical protein